MSTKRSDLYSQLSIKPPQRRVLDIGTWRRALKSADQGKIKELHELYDDILIDTKLSDAIDKRIEAVLESNLTFVNSDKEEVEEVTDLMETEDWEELLTIIMKARFWGRSGAELSFNNDGKLGVKEIPSKHINLKEQAILIRDSDRTGIPYKNDPFLIILGKEKNKGLLLKVAPYVIYKRGGFGDWAQWIELFGMPQRIGKYNIHDPASRAALEEALERAGSASWITAPEGTSIEHVQTNSGNGVAYDDFRKACNEEMTIAVLGQTLTTTQGDTGARALGQVHQEIEAGKHRSDLRYAQRILNQYVLPRLEARGYPVTGGKFVYPKVAEQLSVADIMLLSDIMDIPKSYLHERYAIPMATDESDLARRATSMPLLPAYQEEVDESLEDKPSGQKTSLMDEYQLVRNSSDEDGVWCRIKRFFGYAPSITLGASILGRHTTDIRLADAATINDRLIERTISGVLGDFDEELWRWTSNRLIMALEEGFKKRVKLSDITTTYGAQRDALITAMEINLYRFGAAKTLVQAQHLNYLFRNSKSLEDFKSEAGSMLDRYNKQWLETEYNTAHLSALSAAKHQELKAKTTLYPYWEYKTIRDDRVRAEHAELDGIILRHDDPLWDEIYPPNGYNCRCAVEPRLDHEGRQTDVQEMRKRVRTYQKSQDWQNAKAMGWDSNRATLGEVFSVNQQYVNKMPGKSQANLDQLTASKWGVPAVSKEMKGKPDMPETNQTRDELWELLGGGERVEVKDYVQRHVAVLWDDFDKHTDPNDPKYAERIRLFRAALETLQSPDEVWLSHQYPDKTTKDYLRSRKKKVQSSRKTGQNGYSLIKYYKDDVILVRYRITPEGIILKTWYSIDLNKENINQQRRGLLIYKRKEGES